MEQKQDDAERLREEQLRIRRMRLLVDLVAQTLYQDSSLSLQEGRELVEKLREAVLRLFPGKETTFEIVLRPRFDRILAERWGEATRRFQ